MTGESSYHVVDDLMNAPFELNWVNLLLHTSLIIIDKLQDMWDSHFLPSNNPGDTPPELWNFSSVPNPFVVPDGTGNVMDWGPVT